MTSKSWLNFLCYLLGAALFIFVAHTYRAIFRPMFLPATDIIYEYPKGTPVKSMSKDLEAKGYISSALTFEWYVRLTGSDKKMHAGEYLLKPGMSANALIFKMRKGEMFMHALRVPDGGTVQDVIQMISADPAIDHTLSFQKHWSRVVTTEHPSLEGLLMPETYFFPKSERDLAIIKRAYDDMIRYVSIEFAKRDTSVPFKNIYETLIVASILEKEASLPDERTKVARVIINRLSKGMPLQMDPTVIYGMGDAFKGNLSKNDLQTPGPYNTYLNLGLPPTPICFPSKNAIWSALHPVQGKYLYFVSQGDGSHVFSDNLESHNKAVVRYLQRK